LTRVYSLPEDKRKSSQQSPKPRPKQQRPLLSALGQKLRKRLKKPKTKIMTQLKTLSPRPKRL